MCWGAILAELIPARVHRPLTVATLWPAAEGGITTSKRKAADVDEFEAVTDDEEFEAEFQLFVDDDDDEEPSPPAASPEAGGCRSKAAPSLAVSGAAVSTTPHLAGPSSKKYRGVRYRRSGRWAPEIRGPQQATPHRGKSARLNFPLPHESPRRHTPVGIDLNLPAVSDDLGATAGDGTMDAEENAGDVRSAEMGSEAVQSTLVRIKELITQGTHDERIVSELKMNEAPGALQYAALIAECSRRMEEIAALRRDLETRERHLVRLVSHVLR